MGWFRRTKTQAADAAPLREFLQSRRGVEGYVEPATQFNPTTLVLVAGDGESIRRQVKSAAWASDFCRKAEIPCYDVNRIGYPQRMREYKQAARDRTRAEEAPRRESTGPSSAERDAILVLETIAGADPVADGRPSDDVLRSMHRQARIAAHPDRHEGDRGRWDQVEQAARTLGLT